MKTCHACGQKLPLKCGQWVEWTHNGRSVRGVVTSLGQDGYFADLMTQDGEDVFSVKVTRLTRLHGYYRITEREPLT